MDDICKRIVHGDKNQFKDDKRETIIAYGSATFVPPGKYSGPVEGIRRALRRRGQEICLVSEPYTSMLCSNCNQRLEPMYEMFEGKRQAIHAVRRCTNNDCKCMVWHRDVNACLNIMYLFDEECVHGRDRPAPFTRVYQQQLQQQLQQH